MRSLLIAFATLASASIGAHAQSVFPTPSGGEVSGSVLMCVASNGSAVPCGTSGTSLPASSGTAAVPTLAAMQNPTITTTNTYQTAFAAGATAAAGGCIYVLSSSGTVYVDPTGATGTTLGNGALPAVAGGHVCWPTTSTAVTVYGPAGSTLKGAAG